MRLLYGTVFIMVLMVYLRDSRWIKAYVSNAPCRCWLVLISQDQLGPLFTLLGPSELYLRYHMDLRRYHSALRYVA